MSLEFDPSGWVYSCCASGMYPLGRIGHDRLRDLWAGPRARVFRESLERWDLTIACGACRWHLEHERTDPVAAVYDRYPLTTSEPSAPFMMNFALSNRCNLGCVMCTPELSSTLRKKAGLSALESPYGDQFFEDLEPMLEGIGLAKFLGGEPFLAPENRRIWDLLDRLQDPPPIEITTNGSIWNDQVERVLDRFRTGISISVDAATASTYELVRPGGDFERLMTNVDRFHERSRAKGTTLHVSFCLMEKNAVELADFLLWAERFEIPASINLVTDLGLALHDLSLGDLESVRQTWADDDARIGATLVHNSEIWETQIRQLDSVITERRAGIGPAPRQGRPADRDLFAEEPKPRTRWRRSTTPWASDADVRTESDMLRRWSGGGPVAAILTDRAGRVTRVAETHPRLGLDETLVGQSLSCIVERIEATDGRPAWLVDRDVGSARAVRTLVLTRQQPERGTAGSIVRTVRLARRNGAVLLVAEDRIYERGEPMQQPTPVTIAGPPARSSS